MPHRKSAVLLSAVLLFSACIALVVAAGEADAQPARPRATPQPSSPPAAVQLTPLEAMKILSQRGEWAKVKALALVDLWNDISRPETLQHFVTACQKLGEKEQAGAYCHILLAVLESKPVAPAPTTPAFRKWADAQLPSLDADFEKACKEYLSSAAGKRFTTPEAVSDLWMTQVKSDPQNPHGLYAWTLVGGRKDAKPDWIHNRQGSMHRSCMKLCEEVEGRKGVLFNIPVKLPADGNAAPAGAGANSTAGKADANGDRSQKTLFERLGHPTQIVMPNAGHCRFFRAGVRAYGFPFLFRVTMGGKELLSQRVETTAWTDLKADLGEAAAKDAPIVVELIVPAGQKYSEGAWIDYMDFFVD